MADQPQIGGTRQGLTFSEVLSQSVKAPGFLENFYRLCPVPVYRAPLSPMARLVDEACFSPEELRRKRDEHAAYLTAFVFLTVWLRLEHLEGENTAILDSVLMSMGKRDAPELFRESGVPRG